MYTFKLRDPHFLPHIGCDIELPLEAGKGHLLLGENGVGKTTLLNRIYKAVGGVYVEQKSLDFFYDRTLNEIKNILQELGQGENLEELWGLFGLAEKGMRYLSTLSGGENQALKLATSLCLPSDFYLLDEPSQFLDQDKKRKLSEVLKKKIAENKTVIVVEHNAEWLPPGFYAIELVTQEEWVKGGRTWTT